MVTHAGNDLRIWLDGNQVTRATFDPSATAATAHTITAPSSGITNLAYAWLGGRYTVGITDNNGYKMNYMTGNKYADFRIYDKALSEREIAKLKAEEIDEKLETLNAK